MYRIVELTTRFLYETVTAASGCAYKRNLEQTFWEILTTNWKNEILV